MWNLEYELIAILLLTAIIGLIMGRFLCKSGESEEKRAKEKVSYSLKSAQSDLVSLQVTTENQQESIKKNEQIISLLEQDKSNLISRLESSELQSQTLLLELKELEKYRTRHEALTKEFEVQSEAMEQLKAQKGSSLEEIEQFKVQTNTLKQNIANMEEENSGIVAYKNKQEKLLDELVTINKNQDKTIYELTLLKDENTLRIEEYSKFQIELEEQVKENLLEIEKLKELEEEYNVYKEAFNEEKLLKLEERLEVLYEEREDLTSRLRAISSVVNAVGVEEES
jgi:chromosome segregation ATPase